MSKGCFVNLFSGVNKKNLFIRVVFKAFLLIGANYIFIFSFSLELWVCVFPSNLKSMTQTKQVYVDLFRFSNMFKTFITEQNTHLDVISSDTC